MVRTDNIRTTGFTRPAGQTAAIATYNCVHMGVSPANTDRIVIVCETKTPRISTDGGVIFTEVTDVSGTGDGNRGDLDGDATAVYPHPYDENFWFAPTNQTMSRSINGGARFEGNLVAYFDGSHDKGWGFGSDGDWQKFAVAQQDYAIRWSTAGANYFYGSGLSVWPSYRHMTTAEANILNPLYNRTADNAYVAGDVVRVAEMLALAASANTENYTSAQGALLCPGNRVITGLNRGTASSRNLIMIGEDPPLNNGTYAAGNYRRFIVREDMGPTTIAKTRIHPTDNDMAFMGRFRFTNLGAASRELPDNPLSTTSGSSTVTINHPAQAETAWT